MIVEKFLNRFLTLYVGNACQGVRFSFLHYLIVLISCNPISLPLFLMGRDLNCIDPVEDLIKIVIFIAAAINELPHLFVFLYVLVKAAENCTCVFGTALIKFAGNKVVFVFRRSSSDTFFHVDSISAQVFLGTFLSKGILVELLLLPAFHHVGNISVDSAGLDEE